MSEIAYPDDPVSLKGALERLRHLDENLFRIQFGAPPQYGYGPPVPTLLAALHDGRLMAFRDSEGVVPPSYWYDKTEAFLNEAKDRLVVSEAATFRLWPGVEDGDSFVRKLEQNYRFIEPVAVTAAERRRYTLLWDAADRMAKANGQPGERNWCVLMAAFWRGDLAPDGLVYFYRAGCPNTYTTGDVLIEKAMRKRDEMAALLLDRHAGDQAYDALQLWRVAEYEKTWMESEFKRDGDGLVGLAVLTVELDRWQGNASPSAKQPSPSAGQTSSDVLAPAGNKVHRRGPLPGTVDKYSEMDRALYPEIERLLREENTAGRRATLSGITLQLAKAGKIAGGPALPESLAKRVHNKYKKDHPDFGMG